MPAPSSRAKIAASFRVLRWANQFMRDVANPLSAKGCVRMNRCVIVSCQLGPRNYVYTTGRWADTHRAMLCCVCKEKEAKVHLTQIVGDKMQKVDLCEGCAA